MKAKKLTAILLSAAMAASMFTGCGVNKNATAATLGSTNVSLGLVNFMVRYNQAEMDDLYVAYASYFGDDPWNTDIYGTGATGLEDTEDTILDTLHEQYTLAAHMDEYGVALTDEEEAAITEAASAFMKANSRKALNELGATQDIVEEMLRLYTIEEKMEAAIKDAAEIEVSDEEANMAGYTVVTYAIDSYYDSDSASYVSYTDEEVSAIQATFVAMKQLVDDGSTLEEAAETYGLSASYKTYSTYEEDGSEDTLILMLSQLSEGEVSEVFSTDEDIYIVRLDTLSDADATAEQMEDLISDKKSDAYDEVLAAWQEDDGWTVNSSKLSAIQIKNRFTTTAETEEESATESVTEN